MRILIDMQGMQSLGRDRGIGRYSRSFTKSFIQAAQSHEIYLLLNRLSPDTVKVIRKEFKSLLPAGNFIFFDAVEPVNELDPSNIWNVKASELIREKLIEDISPDFIILTSLFEGIRDNSVTSIGTYTQKIPTAVIFYDLIPYMRPDKFLDSEAMKKWYLRKIDSLKRADALLAISFSAESEAAIFLGKNNSELTTISSATDETFRVGNYDPNTLNRYNIVRPFIMHTSAYEERKNFDGLIKAFAMLPEKLREKYQLVLVCKLTEKQHKYLKKVANNAGLNENDLVLTGFVLDRDLISLYTKAELFVFPSRHEGFGLPALEAMSCGTATIGSDISSIPEVLGCSDALFDPANIESIAKKIEEVLSDNALKTSLEMHAQIQSKKFSWEITANKALKFLEKKHQLNPSKSLLPKNQEQIRQSTSQLVKSIKTLKVLTSPSKGQLRRAAQAIARNEETAIALISQDNTSSALKWRIEGPFDSSYSLALLNRETARALDALGCNVALHSTEGPGDFDPDPEFLTKNPDIKQFYNKSFEIDEYHADVCSRNLYPPRVSDMHSHINLLHHYAWEESGFPQQWVKNFNASLDAMTCLSSHVQKIMLDNGVSIPMSTSGCGVDHWEKIIPDKTYQIKAKKFRFLHVSSCFPRKGADILLKAYGDIFTGNDDVSLIIKTFPNPHNEVHQWLKQAKEKHSNYPDVVIIEDDLTEAKLKSIYEQCHTLVAPSRAEGFGLPIAEAMLSGLPVITTGWGGQVDFCNDETAWLIDYGFAPAQTHFELFDSVWAEPSREHLAQLMRKVYELPETSRTIRSKKGRKLLLDQFKWIDVAQRLVTASTSLPESNQISNLKIGWISTWNTKCGIAAYSEHLINAISQDITILAPYSDQLIVEDKSNVHRCWHIGDGYPLDELSKTIDKLDIDTLVFQFNYSFFDFTHFTHLITEQKTKGRTIIIMIHATTDSPLTPHKQLNMIAPALQKATRLLVHTVDDLNRLKSYGLINNVTLFPHGILDSKVTKKESQTSFVLATYGFALPHKGLLEAVDTFHILLNKGLQIKLKMINAVYPVPGSDLLIEQINERIQTLGLSQHIELITDFLPDEASLLHLSSADLIIFPYQETGESSSAAVRYGLATNNPVAVTPLKIFEDVAPAVFTFSGSSPQEMAQSIEDIMTQLKDNTSLAEKKSKDAEKWRQAHRYTALGERLSNMIIALNQTDKTIMA